MKAFRSDMGAAEGIVSEVARKTAVLGRQGDVRELKVREPSSSSRCSADHYLQGIFLYLASDASTFTTGAGTLIERRCLIVWLTRGTQS